MTYQPEHPLPEAAVAIIGMSGRFPGADDVDGLWRLLVDAEEGVKDYSAEELTEAGVPQRLLDDPAYVRSGHPVEGFDLFDAEFFGIPKAEADLMDPQHRLLLEEAWRALERAGHAPRGGERTGVFAGISAPSYLLQRVAARSAQISDELQVAIGNDPGMLALRVSYKLGLKGPSFTVQSACSSSLVAVHLAVQSLLSQECDLALAGGVAVRQLEPGGYRYEQGAILSTDGRCRPFDAAATGTASGDGVGVVVLKRLEEALADGDHIHAVIRGSAVNNDGSAKVGFTAPSPEGQAEVIAEALAVAGVEPATIQYIEAHGTATPLGDPIEVQALTRAFGPGIRAGSCLLGSVKSNLGHLDAAAGVTGLIKAALALEHGYIPPTLHFTSPNPELGLEETPFRVNAEGVPWPEAGHPARAGVSAFGIGGTNAHVVLEAAPPVRRETGEQRRWQLLPLSARTPEALERSAALLAEHLATDAAELADVAHSLQTGRVAFAHRRAVVCEDHEGAIGALQRPDSKPAGRGDTPPSVVFMFPGQASQYPGMAAELYRAEPAFRAALDECAELLLPHLGWDVREVAFAEDSEEARERLRQTRYTQPTVFSIDYALAKLLFSWGVRPAAMTGHSLGELVAATLAGVFSLEDALHMVAVRANLMQDLEPGRMLSVLLDEPTVEKLLGGVATIAAVNAPASCVVAGTAQEVAEARRILDEQGVPVRELDTSHAFHTALVEPALPGLAEVLRSIRLAKPAMPFLSNVSGTWITDEQAVDPEYWVAHTRRPVRFSDGVATVVANGPAVLVEVGPGSALSGLVKSRPEPEEGTRPAVVTMLRRPRDGQAMESKSVLEGLAELWRLGVPVDWNALHEGGPRRRVPLPTYPFERRSHLLPRIERQGAALRREPSRWTYAPVWHRAPLPAPGKDGDRLDWLVLEDGRGLAAGLSAELREQGHAVVGVRVGDAYARVDRDTFELDPAQPEDLGRLVRELRQEGRLPDRVVHGWLLAEAGGYDIEEDYRRSLDRGFHSLVSLAQAMGESGDGRPVRVTVLTDDLQDVLGGPVTQPERATVLGAVTVLPQEYPALNCRTVDISAPSDPEGRKRLAALLTAELMDDQQDSLVAYRGAQRWRRAFAPVRLAAVSPADAFREDAGYLITGASAEAGLVFAEQLAEQGLRLYVVGDDSGDGDRAARLAALTEGRPDQVHFRTASLADPEQARQVVAEARERLGGLAGVLHLVDTRGTGMMALKSREDSAAVLDARVRSTLLLGELLREDSLDFLLVGSSVTGIVGGFGQAENCAAAAFLDAFAQAGTAAGLPVVAVDWSQWEWDDWFEQQMAGLPEVREQYRQLREEQGIPVADGLGIARAVLKAGLPQVVVSTVDFDEVLADAATLTATTFTDSLSGTAAAEDWDPATEFPDDELAQSIARIWRDLLGVARVAPDDDFYELGGNSLFAIQIVSRLRQIHGDFPMSAIFESPTVPALADTIRAHQAESIGLDEFEALLREVESLSLEEAEAKLKGDHA